MKNNPFIISIFFISFLLSGCVHEHAYTDATCTIPQTCKECGETKGEPLGHIFLEATCETSQICEKCGFTGQDALGHTTKVGKCDRCSLYQGKDIINNILEKLKYADSITELAFTVQMTNADYDSILNGLSYFESAKTEYESALKLCGNYSDLATLKEDINSVINSLPLSLTDNNKDSISSYLDDLSEFVIVQAKCQLTAIAVKDLIE